MDPNVHVQVDNPPYTHLATFALYMECAASLAGKTIFFQRSLQSV